jgi:lambda family phage tail tape measure protein
MSKAMSQERQIDKQLNTDRYFKQAQAIDSVTAAMQKQNEVFKAAGIRSPQAISNELKALRDSKAAWEALGPATEGYNGALAEITRKTNILTEGNARARGSFHKMTAALASLTFEVTGAVYGLAAIGGAIASGAIFGIKFLKDIEDAKMGISGTVLSMNLLAGEAMTTSQAMGVADGVISKLEQDSLKYNVSLADTAKLFQAIVGPGTAARMTMDEIGKTAVIGAVAVKSMGLNSMQVVQEVRDLVQGGIQAASSTLATALGLNDKQIKAAKESSQGLFAFLEERMAGFAMMSMERNNTLSGSWDMLWMKVQRLFADPQVFSALVEGIKEISNAIGTIETDSEGNFKGLKLNPDLVSAVKLYSEAITGTIKVLAAVAEYTIKWYDAISLVAGFFVANKLFGTILPLFATYIVRLEAAAVATIALGTASEVMAAKSVASAEVVAAAGGTLAKGSLAARGGLYGMLLWGVYELADFAFHSKWVEDNIFATMMQIGNWWDETKKKMGMGSQQEVIQGRIAKLQSLKPADFKTDMFGSGEDKWKANLAAIESYKKQLETVAPVEKKVTTVIDTEQAYRVATIQQGLKAQNKLREDYEKSDPTAKRNKAIEQANESLKLSLMAVGEQMKQGKLTEEESKSKQLEIVKHYNAAIAEAEKSTESKRSSVRSTAAKEARDLLKQSVDDYKAIESALNESVTNGSITYIEGYNARIAALNSYIAVNGTNNKLVTERNKTETELVKFTDDLLKKSVDLKIKYYGDTMSAGDAYMAEFEANSSKERKIVEDTIAGIESLKRELDPSELAALAKAKEYLLNFDKAEKAAKSISVLKTALQQLEVIAAKTQSKLSDIDMGVARSGGYQSAIDASEITKLEELRLSYEASKTALDSYNISLDVTGEAASKQAEEILKLKAAVDKSEKSYLDLKNAMDKTFGRGMDKAVADYIKSANDMATQSNNLFSNMFKNLEDAFTNFIMTGKMDFKSFVNSMIADLARMAAKQIVLSFAGSFGGMFGVAGAAGSAGSSMLSSAAGSAAGNLLGSTISGAGIGAIASGAAYGTGFMSQQSLMLLAQESTGVVASLAEVGSTISGALSAIPGWGWALAGGALLADSLGLFGEAGGPKVGGLGLVNTAGVGQTMQYEQETYTHGGTSSGGDPFHVADITTASMTQIKDLAGKFGKTLSEEFTFGLAAEFDPEGTASGWLRYIVNGEVTSKEVGGQDVEAGAKEFLITAQRGMIASLAEIDLSPVVDPLLDSIPDIASLTEQQAANILKIVSDLSETSAQSLDDLFGEAFDISKFEPFKQEGELTIETFGRLANVFSSTNVIAEMLGQDTATAFGEIGLASSEMRQSLIDGAGGLENLGNQATFFYQNFYTEAERASIDIKKASDQVSYAFAEMGIAIPESDKAFRDLVKGLDLGTEAGQKMYQSLMDIAPAFAKVEQASKAALQSIAGSLDKLKGGQANTKFLAEQEAASTFSAVQAAMPWITSIEQLATITLEDAANYSSANQQLIAAALEAEAAVNGFSESVAETAKAITENSNVFITSIGEVWDSARQKVDEIANTAANIVGESPTSTVSDKYMAQIAAIQQVLEQAKTTYAAGTTLKQGSNTYELYLSQAQKTELEELIRYSNERIVALKGELEQYVALEAAYPGHGEALQDLEKWYKTQKETLMSTGESVEQNMLLMEMLEKTYQEKRNAILNDGISEGLENAKTALRKWIDSMYFNEQLSPLTAQQKFEESQSQYVENLMKAQGGDVEAISNFQKYAEEYLKQAKNMYGFGGDYSAIWKSIMEQAGILSPELVIPENTISQPATTNDIAELTSQVNELKEVLARVMEKGNTITQEQTTQLVSAIRDGSATQARATTNAVTVQSRT